MRRIHPALFWPITLVIVVGGACLLAAPVHELLMDAGALTRHAPGKDLDKDFLRVFRRLLLIPLLAVFLWRVRPWRDGQPGAFGLLPTVPRLRLAAVGCASVVVLLLAVLGWQLALGWLSWEQPPRWGELARRLGLYVLGGLLAGLLEEWFFRGWLLDRITQRAGARAALFLAALTYALVHAFSPSRLTVSVSHDAAGAFEALRGWLSVVLDVRAFGPPAIGLFCFALVLTAARRRWASLWPGIGMHAGAMLVIFSYGAVTDRHPAGTWAGTRLLYDSPVVWALALAGAWWLSRRRADPAADPAGDTAG